MKATKEKIEDLFPSVYITLFSILLGFAVEDVVTQLRENAPIDAYSLLSAIAILSALIAGWIGLSFVAIAQDRLPKIQDVLNVFILALSWYVMTSTLGMDIWWFFCAIWLYDGISVPATVYNGKAFMENASTSYDQRIIRRNWYILLPSLVIYPFAALMSARGILPFGIEIALLLYIPFRNVLWVYLFYNAWSKVINEMA